MIRPSTIQFEMNFIIYTIQRLMSALFKGVAASTYCTSFMGVVMQHLFRTASYYSLIAKDFCVQHREFSSDSDTDNIDLQISSTTM